MSSKEHVRNHRICFRTTRGDYYLAENAARQYGTTRSELVYWLAFAGLFDFYNLRQDDWIESMRARMGEVALARFNKFVEKAVDVPNPDDVPW